MRTRQKLLVQRIYNLAGWHTRRKIVVFESDDWGNSVNYSQNTHQELLRNNIHVDRNPYTRYDALASEDDLSALFELLNSFIDKHGNHPLITANFVMANPAFEKIANNGFKKYVYELFPETLKRLPSHQNSLALMKEGIAKGLILPQFHGREHLNGRLWVDQLRLQSVHSAIRTAFDHQLAFLPREISPEINHNFNSAFWPSNERERKDMMQSIGEGLNAFESVFGFRASSFVATGYIWNREIEPELKKHGIEFLQSLPIQYEPVFNKTRLKRRIHYTGQYNRHGQLFMIRNAFFEPSINPSRDWVSECLKRIELNFKRLKPAIISTHRLNFIGYIDAENRNENLLLFRELIASILKKWPDVEFMSSVALGNLIKSSG